MSTASVVQAAEGHYTHVLFVDRNAQMSPEDLALLRSKGLTVIEVSGEPNRNVVYHTYYSS